jgi:hypothetical protein
MKFLKVINPEEKKIIQLDAKYSITEDKKISVVASLLGDEVTYFKFKGLFIAQ